MTPLDRGRGGLAAARLALAAPERPRLRSRAVLACAAAMAAAAIALCAVVLLGDESPRATGASTTGVRAALRR